MDEILDSETRTRILERIEPTPEELRIQRKTIAHLIELLMTVGADKGYEYSFIEAQGSTGKKQTQLRNAADIDLFVGLEPEDYSQYLDRSPADRHKAIHGLMNELVDNWFAPAISSSSAMSNIRKTYSQHPYLSLKSSNLEIDILACFDLDPDTLENEGPITAVDRTKHHSDFIAARLTQRSRGDARILKSFVRAAHAYGDRCAIGQMGLTGVALEYAAILSNDLEEAIEKVYGLKESPIDHKNRSMEELKEMPAFKDDFIFIIDPTDSMRNMAASYSERSYEWIRHRIDQLGKTITNGRNQDIPRFFLEEPIPDDEIPEPQSSHILAEEYASDGSIHYTILRDKLHRFMRKVEKTLATERTGETRFGQILSELYIERNRYALGFLVENSTISKEYVRRGPRVSLESACIQFRKHHPDATESDGYLWSIEQREWTDAKELIMHLLKDLKIEGLTRAPSTIASRRVRNVLHHFILQITPSLHEKLTGLYG